MNKPRAREVKKGQWLYDKLKPMTVKIFALNFDYYYEIAKADDMLEEDESPELNVDGESYMIKWGDGDFFDKDLATKDWGGLDLKSAMKKAKDKVEGGIRWKV